MKKMIVSSIGGILGMLILSSAQAQTADIVGKHKDWKSHVFKQDGKKICFVSSQPIDSEPKHVKRGQIVFYVSSWPQEKIRHEISVKIGYPFKPGSQPVAEVDDKSYKFIVKSDKAFVETSDQEKRMFRAMKAGKSMIVKGVSRRGTVTTDEYSLAGLSAALRKMKSACR